MNQETLKQRLEEAGYSKSHYSIGERGDDTFCLEYVDGAWQVFYTERGVLGEVFFRSESEEAACAFLWEKMQGIRHDHLVGYFTNLGEAQACAGALTRLGLANHIDHLPITRPPLFRVFVYGRDLFEVQKYFPDLPLRHWSVSSNEWPTL